MQSDLPDWDTFLAVRDHESDRAVERKRRMAFLKAKRKRKSALHLSIVAGIALSMSLGAHYMADALFVFLAGLVEVY